MMLTEKAYGVVSELFAIAESRGEVIEQCFAMMVNQIFKKIAPNPTELQGDPSHPSTDDRSQSERLQSVSDFVRYRIHSVEGMDSDGEPEAMDVTEAVFQATLEALLALSTDPGANSEAPERPHGVNQPAHAVDARISRHLFKKYESSKQLLVSNRCRVMLQEVLADKVGHDMININARVG